MSMIYRIKNSSNFFIFFSIAIALSNSIAIADAPSLPTPNSEPLPSSYEVPNQDVILTEKVQKEIRNNPMLKDEPVSAASHQGIIILQGSVKTKEQETSAINSAKSVKGVKEVKSQLSIGNHG